MKIFTSWMYLRSTALRYKITNASFMQSVTPRTAVKAWLLGDYLLVPKFQNDMIRYILADDMFAHGPEMIREFGEQVPEDSALETFFVNLFCYLMVMEHLEEPRIMFGWLTGRLLSKVSKELASALLRCHVDKNRWWAMDSSGLYRVDEGHNAIK
ncbi:hypothetical protein O1611_g3559 [Lasiodiplodia mahajangana]|uniref:Uncharacterized protein n=1 Tax=Lasiodiplodia mahajangana TaxID=1108764 RepID=A0ACC2JRD0_9PEZI|nr:hypothetical protein O1611_g3559 [Lasiodiplodia mahajangana]